ncbi:hypothetical protein [Chromobacterium haemolyticum]|uniref:hypothetical protein n=1 Tax=Chromobacterium haemolyticum TaxID=394935 RepID=UPI0012DC33F6|nr:hypothetical protein [Chromobacterium haemolyticum]
MQFNDVLRYMQQPEIRQDCPGCIKPGPWIIHDLGVIDHLKGRAYCLPMASVGYYDGSSNIYVTGFPLVIVECSNCGFIKNFNYHKIRLWLAANPLPTQNPESQYVQDPQSPPQSPQGD